jgi:hypothetical protein
MGRTNYRNVAYLGIHPFFFESGRMKQSKVLGKDGTQVIEGKIHIQHAITETCWSRVQWWLLAAFSSAFAMTFTFPTGTSPIS